MGSQFALPEAPTSAHLEADPHPKPKWPHVQADPTECEGPPMRGSLLLIALLLASVASTQAVLTIYHTSEPPVLDGALDDACWQAASVASHFISAQKDRLPEEQTQARACWDDENLYLGIEAFEGMLEPKLNMLHLVKADKTGRDARVFGDDCVEIFLQPGGGEYFHLGANSTTGTYDARGTDSAWNCDWQCVAKRLTASYVLEASIPLSSLSDATPTEWKANFTRHRPHAKEYSTWSGLKDAFHQPEAFGTLRFAQTGPTLAPAAIDQRDGIVEVTTTVGGDADDETAVSASLDIGTTSTVKGAGEHVMRLTVEGETVRSLTYALAQADDVLLRSAPIPLSVAAGAIRIATDTRDCETTAYLNGNPVTDPELQLQPGLNTVALEVRPTGNRPSASPALLHQGRELPVAWAALAELPEAGWLDGDVPPTASEASQGFLAAAVYVGEPRPQFFPNMDTFHAPRGSAQLMRLYVHPAAGIPSSEYRMVVELPERMRYAAADPLGGGAVPTVTRAGRLQSDGATLARHHVDFSRMPGQGMELSMRWGDETGHTLTYQPTIATGGTHDWQHLSMTVTAPKGAVDVHPLIIKWQSRGIVGTFWVDNLVFREDGGEENLLKMGTFDEDGWENHWILKPEGPDGSKCCKIVSTKEGADKQQALWVDKDDLVPVEAGKQYVVEADVRCDRLGSPDSRATCGLLFEAPRNMPEGESPVYTYFQTLNGLVTELPTESRVMVLPPLRNVRPERARIMPCYYGSRFSDPTVAEAMAENCWAAGITWTYGKLANDVVDHVLDRGHQVVLSIGYEPWGAPAGAKHLLEDDEGLRALGFDGKRIKHQFCPTWVLADGDEVIDALEEWLLGVVNNEPYAGANWDLEQPVIDPPTFCVCERCLIAFRDFADLADATDLSGEILLSDYPSEWTDFRCTQNAELAGHIRAILDRADREIEFSLYSGHESNRTKEHYGVDWALMAPHLDLGIAGYGAPRETVQATIEALDGVPLIGGEMWYLSDRDDARPMPKMQTWRNRVLRQYADSGGNGCLIWWLPPMDGGAFYATSEAAEIIAEYEEFFALENRCDAKLAVTGIPENDWFAFEKGGQTLVMLLNFRAEPVTAVVDGDEREIEAYGVDVTVSE